MKTKHLRTFPIAFTIGGCLFFSQSTPDTKKTPSASVFFTPNNTPTSSPTQTQPSPSQDTGAQGPVPSPTPTCGGSFGSVVKFADDNPKDAPLIRGDSSGITEHILYRYNITGQTDFIIFGFGFTMETSPSIMIDIGENMRKLYSSSTPTYTYGYGISAEGKTQIRFRLHISTIPETTFELPFDRFYDFREIETELKAYCNSNGYAYWKGGCVRDNGEYVFEKDNFYKYNSTDFNGGVALIEEGTSSFIYRAGVFPANKPVVIELTHVSSEGNASQQGEKRALDVKINLETVSAIAACKFPYSYNIATGHTRPRWWTRIYEYAPYLGD